MSTLPLARRRGLYVIDFGDRVKIGTSTSLRGRLLQHHTDGAKRATIYPGAWGTLIETTALRTARRHGQQIGKTESFTGLTYRDAQTIVRRALRAARASTASERIDLAALGATRCTPVHLRVPLARLTEEPKP